MDAEIATAQIRDIHVRDFQLSARGRLQIFCDANHVVVININSGHGVTALGLFWLFLDGNGLAIVKLDNAVTFRVIDVVAEDRRAGFELSEHAVKRIAAVKNIVAQDQRDIVPADKTFRDEKGLGNAFGFGLFAIADGDSKARAVAQQLLEPRQIMRRGNKAKLANAPFDERREGVINHWFIIDGLKLFAGDERKRIQPRPGTAGKDDAFHSDRICFSGEELKQKLGGRDGALRRHRPYSGRNFRGTASNHTRCAGASATCHNASHVRMCPAITARQIGGLMNTRIYVAVRDSAFRMMLSMKFLFRIFCLGLAMFAFEASAQVTVEMTLDQGQFLPGEDLVVTVHVTNHSGQLLHLGDSNWLSFFVQSSDGTVVVRKSAPPVKGFFDLDNSEVAIKQVNLGPYFNLQRTGTYRVTANVHIAAWNVDVGSPASSFDVIQGSQMWSQSFGVPDPEMPDQPPRVRKYTLMEANYLKDQLRLYVQVSDESDGTVLKVRAIAPMISFSQPEAQLDRASRLHVLCQSGATAFTYSVIGTDGKVVERDVYDYITTRPRLGEDNDGNIIVRGGVRRVESNEVPLVKTPEQLAH